ACFFFHFFRGKSPKLRSQNGRKAVRCLWARWSMGLPDSVKMSQLRQVAEAVVKDNFLELFDLAARPQGGKTLLSVVLDKPSGRVGLQECEAVSRDLEKRLDELDVMEGSYLLEVSSPGM